MCSSGRITLDHRRHLLLGIQDPIIWAEEHSWKQQGDLVGKKKSSKIFRNRKGEKIPFVVIWLTNNRHVLHSRGQRKGKLHWKLASCRATVRNECRVSVFSCVSVTNLRTCFLGNSKSSSYVLDLNNCFLQHADLALIKYPNVKKAKFLLWMATLQSGVALRINVVSLTWL